MLTLKSIMAAAQQNRSYGQTGKHVHGRGFEGLDGSFTEDTRKPQQASQEAAPKVEGP